MPYAPQIAQIAEQTTDKVALHEGCEELAHKEGVLNYRSVMGQIRQPNTQCFNGVHGGRSMVLLNMI